MSFIVVTLFLLLVFSFTLLCFLSSFSASYLKDTFSSFNLYILLSFLVSLPSIYLHIFKLFSLFFFISSFFFYLCILLLLFSFFLFFSHLVPALLLSSSPPTITHFSRYLRPSFSPFSSFLLRRNIFVNLTLRHLFTLTFFVVL